MGEVLRRRGCEKGPTLAFDITDVPTIFWHGFSKFREDLAQRVQRIASRRTWVAPPA